MGTRDPLIKCKKCGYDEDSSKIHYHHIIPKFMGGNDRDGRLYICEKCHKEIHDILKKLIKETTERWLV